MREFKPFRRVVTGHNADGRAIFKDDSVITPVKSEHGDAGFATIWATETVPADCNDERDGASLPTGLTLHGGSVIRICDILPGEETPMHRTSSIDYGIVISGAIELELDDGVKTTVEAGGIIVQRGTMHAWRNNGEDVCRIVFVLIEAAPYLYNGKPLEDDKPFE